MDYQDILLATNLCFSVVVLVLFVYYLGRHRRLDELSRRLLLMGFFLGVHELTSFLHDPLIYELTKVIFFLTMFYALLYVVSNNVRVTERLEQQMREFDEIKKRLDIIKEEIFPE
jgi:hypothetical protein